MEIQVLDTKVIDRRVWILSKGNLYEYLEGLKEEFYDYSIQRKIVKNQYLDSLIQTILGGDPIPLITLTSSEKSLSPKVGKSLDINMEKVEILDGLQRTFRLWTYFKLLEEFDKNPKQTAPELAKNIKESYPFIFETGVISYSTIKMLVEKNKFSQIKKAIQSFELYFIIWGHLSKKEIINKMLVLNAGQRSVSKTHQYELLFLSLWEDLSHELKDVKLFREKDSGTSEVKSGKREIGDYLYSTIIVGLRSFLETKPLKVSGDLDIIGTAFEDDYRNINEEVFSVDFLKFFLAQIKNVDQAIYDNEGEEGKKWFVRETTIVGILSGLGQYLEISEDLSIEEIKSRASKGFELLVSRCSRPGFKLTQFRDEYNSLYNRSVNVGTFVRSVTKNYTVELLKGKNPLWSKFFDIKG